MPPHGRRRWSSILPVVLPLLLLLVASTSAVSSAVLGVDLGTEYIKATLVKPGVPLDIVLTRDSKRKETAALAFKPLSQKVNTAASTAYPERIYGGDAVALSARFPKDVYSNLKPLLGLKYGSDATIDYRANHPELQMVESKDNGAVAFKSDSFTAEEEAFLVEELLAMELKNIKANAETMAGKAYGIKDIVITVPPFYTVEERRAVQTAAELAGLKVLSLISDGLAVGLDYAKSRVFPTVNSGGKPEKHLIYDMGAGSTTATVLKFQGRTVKDVGKFNKTVQEVHVLATGWDRSLGGDALNTIIMDDMVKTFTEKTTVKAVGLEAKHVKSHGRTMAKLWKESERVRQVLSANSETSASFEGLYYEDQTLKYKLSRSDFESMASQYHDRVQRPILDALASAKLSIHDLDSIILHGGAVRTPFVQRQLENLIKGSDKIRTNVNSDEAAVFGAGFKAAAISPSFRVKEIRTFDNSVYPVVASWTVEGKEKQQKLFVPTSAVGTEKQVTFKVLADFDFSLSQEVAEPGASSALLSVSQTKTQNLTQSVKALSSQAGCATNEINTQFAIRLNPADGLPEVTSASVSCESSEAERKGVVDGMKDFLGFGARKDEQQPLQDADKSVSSDGSDPTSVLESPTTSVPKAAVTSSEASSSVENKTAPGKKIVTIALGFKSEASSLADTRSGHHESVVKRLLAFDVSDRSRAQREETLNNLEAYTYKIRDILQEEGFIGASTLAQRNEIEQRSSETSSWLYDDGVGAARDVLKAKLDDLRNLVKPVQRRKEEALKRPEAVKQLRDGLQQAQTMVQIIRKQQEEQAVATDPSSSTPSSVGEAETSQVSSTSVDDFAGLDDEPTSTSTLSIEPSDVPKPLYSKQDLNNISERQESIQKWLEEKEQEQDRLSLSDEPVLLSSDLDARTKELNEMITNLLTKQMKASKPRKSKPSKDGERARTSTPKSSEAAETNSTTSPAEPEPTQATEAESTPAQAADSETSTDGGNWAERTSDPEPGQGVPSIEEEMEIRRIQQEIDERLAAEKSSIVAKAEANKTKKAKKAKATAKAKGQVKRGKQSKEKLKDEL